MMAEQTVEGDPSFVPAAPTTSSSNGAVAAANLPPNLSNDAKTLLTTILGANNSQSNLQVLSMAAAANSSQKLPSLKPTASPGHSVTTPTQVTPISTRKRGRPPASADHDDGVKRRKGSAAYGGGSSVGVSGRATTGPANEKQSKGLRHFSQLVCEKVREKGVTTYNEVADELVKELSEAERKAGQDGQIDQKNIRRRVYDALNVLMAMNIINKEKKEIKWIGLPTNSVQECEHIQLELSQQEERISKKTAELHELVLQILTLKNLIKRNREKAEIGDSPSQHSAIGLPFILVNTSKNTIIDCSISSDKSEYVFTFDNTFELHQDVDILNKMDLDCGLYSGKATPQSLAEAKHMLPKVFEGVVDEMALLSQTMPQSPTPVTSEVPSSTVTSTPTSQQPHPTALPTNLLTPLLNEHSNGTTTSSAGPLSNASPFAIAAAAALANSQNPASMAAAISTLQQLHQLPSSPPPSSSSPFRTVTARPLNFTSPTRPPPPPPSSLPPPSSQHSPKLTKTQQTSQHNHHSTSTSSTGTLPQQSPKVVTVQPLPSVTSRVAEMIASLQSSILMQQQHLVAANTGHNEESLTSELLCNKDENHVGNRESDKVEQSTSFCPSTVSYNT